jgi:hypothetical protein
MILIGLSAVTGLQAGVNIGLFLLIEVRKRNIIKTFAVEKNP